MSNFPTAIYWPNGKGERECSQEYADADAEKNTIREKYLDNQGNWNLDEFEPADYERYCQLDSDLGSMQLSGKHLGEVTVYY